MKRSIIVTFLVSFLITFVVGCALFTVFTDHYGMMRNMGLPGLSQLLILFEVSLFIAALFSTLNYIENQHIVQSYEQDISRLIRNETPENKELAQISNRMSDLSAELQKLSTENSVEKASVIEEERRRISRELHDSVSQELFAATMILSSVTDSGDSISADQIQAQTKLALKILHEAQNEMRALLLHLRPTELAGKSLVSGLRGLIDELSEKISSNINYKLAEVSADSSVEDNLFRMAQEILSNALRHSQAESIDVGLYENGNNIFLEIKDNGLGFDPTKVKQASYGLKNLHERALLLGGECQVISAPNKGTIVEIRVPKVENKIRTS